MRIDCCCCRRRRFGDSACATPLLLTHPSQTPLCLNRRGEKLKEQVGSLSADLGKWAAQVTSLQAAKQKDEVGFGLSIQ